MAENCPKLWNETDIQIQEAQTVPNKMNPEIYNKTLILY